MLYMIVLKYLKVLFIIISVMCNMCNVVLYIFTQIAKTLRLVRVSSFFKFNFSKIIQKNNT